MPVSDTIFVSIDLEMTGARPENQEAIEVAAVRFRGDSVLATYSTLVRPTIQLPYNIQVLTGIRPEDLARAPSIDLVKPGLVAFVGRAPIIAHTVSADVGCLARQGIVLENRQIDTHLLASVVLPQMPGYSLSALVAQLGIQYPQQHRAAADAAVTHRLFLALVDRIRELDSGTVQEIVRMLEPHDWPLKWLFEDVRREQARGNAGGVSIRQALSVRGELGDLPLEVLMTAEPIREPLAPVADPEPIDTRRLVDAAANAGESLLDADVEMLGIVADAASAERQVVVETSPRARQALAVVLPAAAHAVANGRQAVIAAASPERQSELLSAAADSARILGTEVRTALIKESTAYVCLRRWTDFRHRPGLSLDESVTLAKTLVWLASTGTGEGSELNLLEGEREIWPRIQAGNVGCDRASCEYARRGICYVERASRRAQAAHVVVASHEALLAAAAAGSASGWEGPSVDVRGCTVIIDEAQDLEDSSTNRLTSSISARSVASVLADLTDGPTGEVAADVRQALIHRPGSRAGVPAGAGLAERLSASVVGASSALEDFMTAVGEVCVHASSDRTGSERRVRLTRSVRARPDWRAVEAKWAGARASLVALARLLAEAAAIAKSGGRAGDATASVRQRLAAGDSAAATAVAALDEAVTAPDVGSAYWLSMQDDGSDPTVHAAPIWVGPALVRDVYDVASSVILLSPTLSVAGGMDYTRGRLGLDGFAERAPGAGQADARGLLLLPRDIADPDQPAHQAHVRDLVLAACLAARGRALVLFSSNGHLRQTWQALQQRLADRGILALGYRADGSPRRYLLETFRTNPASVLFASGTLWESPDLGTLPLRAVVVTRLPFSPPTDPLASARAEACADPMADYGVPRTVLRFRQGILPALRSGEHDYVVVIADRRVQTKGYGDLFLRSVPAGQQKVIGLRDVAPAIAEWVGSS